MTRFDNSWLNMLMAVQQWLTDHNTLVSSMTSITSKKTELTAEITAIQAARQTQDQGMAGTSSTKKQARITLTNGVLKVASGLYAYATANNLPAIKELANISKARLDVLSGQKLIDKAQDVYSTANPLAASLTGFNVVAADLTGLNTAIANFTTQLPKPRERKGDLKQSKAIIDAQTALSRQTLADLKGLMIAFRVTNPNDYASFTSATEIVNPASTTLSFRIKVVAEGTAIPEAGATVEIEAIGYLRTTGVNGTVQEKNVADGNYTFRISKPGKITRSGSFSVTAGEMTAITVELLPLVS